MLPGYGSICGILVASAYSAQHTQQHQAAMAALPYQSMAATQQAFKQTLGPAEKDGSASNDCRHMLVEVVEVQLACLLQRVQGNSKGGCPGPCITSPAKCYCDSQAVCLPFAWGQTETQQA